MYTNYITRNKPPAPSEPSCVCPKLRGHPTSAAVMLMLLIYTYNVLSLELKKPLRHNKSAIDQSDVNPARGQKEGRRSTNHTTLTTRNSNQQGSQSRQNPCQVQPLETIKNVSASRRHFGYELHTVSNVWSVASISESEFLYKLQRRLSDALPIHQAKSSIVTQNVF